MKDTPKFNWIKHVQGHWRTLANGRRVWIAPHVRGPQAPPKQEKKA